MENGVQALMMGVAVLIFVIAFTISFETLAKAKQTSDVILFYSDRNNFQQLVDYEEEDNDGGRIVGVDTVIATVARCIREKFSVKIIGKNKTYEFEYDISTKEEIDDNIKKFIMEFVDGKNGTKFVEKFVEVTASGKTYDVGDGSFLEEDVGKKLYVTYTYIDKSET